MDNLIGGAEYKESHRMVFGNTLYDIKGTTGQNNDLEILNYNYDGGLYTKEEIEAFIIGKDIINKINKNNSDSILLEIYETNPQEIDIEKIYNEVHTEPKERTA